MLELQDVHPRLTDRRIIACRAPLEAGVAKLQGLLESQSIAVFDHITRFDMDGVLTSIERVDGFCDRATGEAHALARAEKLAEPYRSNDWWKEAPDRVREVNVLPATRSLVPGRAPPQFSCAALRADEYSTAYVRLYPLDMSGEADMVDTLLSFIGFEEDFFDLLLRLGGVER